MGSIWQQFQMAGFFGLLTVPVALLVLLLGVVALLGGIVAKNPRAFTFVGSLSVGLGGLGLCLGGAGAWYGRQKVQEALSGAALADFEQMEKIWLVGYEEARAAPVIAMVLVALPLAVSLLASFVSFFRSRNATGGRPTADVVVASSMTLFAIAGFVFAAVSSASGEQAAKDQALEHFRSKTKGALAASGCDPCPMLADAIAYRGAETIDQDVPGATDRARKCVDDWIDRIEKREPAPRACSGRDELLGPDPSRRPPEVEAPAEPDEASDEALTPREKALRDAAEFGMLGLLGGERFDREKELRDLLASPLLIDETQRQRAQAMLEKGNEDEPSEPEKSPSASSRVTSGAPTVMGTLSKDIIRRIVRRNRGRIRACYEQSLRRDPTLEGSLEVRFIISPSGTVATAMVTKGLQDEALRGCVTRAFRTMTFPRPEGVVSVVYPLRFAPAP